MLGKAAVESGVIVKHRYRVKPEYCDPTFIEFECSRCGASAVIFRDYWFMLTVEFNKRQGQNLWSWVGPVSPCKSKGEG